VTTIIARQFAKLREKFPDATMSDGWGGYHQVVSFSLGLADGWNRKSVKVSFRIPLGYPIAQPDAFWTDANLRFASGGMPRSTKLESPVWLNSTGTKLWFSLHLLAWSPKSDTMLN